MTSDYDEVLADAKQLGQIAYQRGGRPSENPYAQGEPALCKAWAQGFKEAYYRDGERGGPA